MTEGEVKPVGRLTKKDVSYVKLEDFGEEWVMMATECVRLKRLKVDEGIFYII